uniref:CCHC-type domain-containing protein n=1 Tax=Fagus sylvatica TaxID=28930 RepID=A0A2N9EU87_FAGSY
MKNQDASTPLNPPLKIPESNSPRRLETPARPCGNRSVNGNKKAAINIVMSLDGISSFFNNLFSRSQPLTMTELLFQKDTKSVTEYMQIVKRYADELALIDAPLNDEDLVIHVLNGLGSDFKEISAADRARDSPISFEELHEKLCDRETFLKREPQRSETPITANVTTKSSHNGKTYTQNHQGRSNNFGNNQYNQSHYSNNRRNHNPKPYRGFCQLCDQQGHTAKRCPRLKTFSPSPPPYQQFGTLCLARTPFAPPRAHFAAQPNLASTNWLVDSGASHHVTADLNNLSLHSEYDGSDDIMIGDGTGLQITHTGSTKLPSSYKSFLTS